MNKKLRQIISWFFKFYKMCHIGALSRGYAYKYILLYMKF